MLLTSALLAGSMETESMVSAGFVATSATVFVSLPVMNGKKRKLFKISYDNEYAAFAFFFFKKRRATQPQIRYFLYEVMSNTDNKYEFTYSNDKIDLPIYN